MTVHRDGMQDLTDILRTLGESEFIRVAEEAGLSPKNHRMRCPFSGCHDQGKNRARNVSIFEGEVPRFHCHRCGTGGRLVDLLMAARGWSEAEAITHLRGLSSGPPPPVPLRPPRPIEQDRLQPQDVQRLWEQLEQVDITGEQYLEGRGLLETTGLKLVRFLSEDAKDKRIAPLARRGYRVAALMSDVTGSPRGIQVRLAREARSREPKIMSVKGSSSGRSFFGEPGAIEGAWLVCVAEGLADTLAVAIWAKGSGAVVVGAAGKDNLARLAEELEAAKVPVKGKTFALFVQNDRPKNLSRREFVRLSQLLSARDAHVVLVNTHDEFKDVAEWRQAHPEAPWPPPALQRVLLPDEREEVPVESRSSTPSGCAVPLSEQIRSDFFAQNYTTLCALLDDPVSREAIMGRGDIAWSEMTCCVMFGGKEVSDVDLSTIRLGIEAAGRTPDNKVLKFGEDEILRALKLVAHRKAVHPLRAWLLSIPKWDGVLRLDIELPASVGHGESSLACVLLSRWMVSVVARAMEPGCKVDTELVLVGPQGVGKSTFFSVLGGQWFTDAPVRVDDKDGKLIMRRAWIVEWAELESMRRAKDQDAIKAFLSTRIDLFRPPYDRGVVEAPRHCVIVGTTNNREFLHDQTGNRRFWPVEVSRCDLHWLRENREQLFAEALQRYQAAFTCDDCRLLLPAERCDAHGWWLSAEEEERLKDLNVQHEAQDVWNDPVEDWLDEHRILDWVTAAQVLQQALNVELKNQGRAEEMRVSAVLRRLGWSRAKRRVDGRARNVYVRPT